MMMMFMMNAPQNPEFYGGWLRARCAFVLPGFGIALILHKGNS